MKTKYFQNCLGVFQGGGVKAIAFAGAYEEAISRGVLFSELVGTSAGSIIAVLIGAGATPDKLYEILERLEFEKFLGKPTRLPGVKYPKYFNIVDLLPISKNHTIVKFFNFARFFGLYSPSYLSEWLNSELKKLLKINYTVKFKHLLIPTSVVAADLQEKKVKIWSSQSNSEDAVSSAVMASCSIPFYFQPHELKYIDGGLLSNLPSFILRTESIFDKILAFGFTETANHEIFDNYQKYFMSVMNTAIDGAVDLQLQMQSNVHLIKIQTSGIEATDFDKLDADKKQNLVSNGKLATKLFFDEETSRIISLRKNEDIGKDIFGTFNFLVQKSYDRCGEILISDVDDPIWVYSLFPTLLKWIKLNTSIKVLLKNYNGTGNEIRSYKTRLLSSLGVEVYENESVPFKGFLFDTKTEDASAVIFNEIPDEKINSKKYSYVEDSSVIGALAREYISIVKEIPSLPSKIDIKIIDESEVFNLLKNVKQYNGTDIHFSIEELDIKDLEFLTKYVKGFKYRQIKTIFDVYEEYKIDLFKPAVIKFENGHSSIITPPVCELHGNGKFIVIEGNARMIYAYKIGKKKIYTIVVKNVSEALPSSGRFNIDEILVADVKKSGENRYNDFNREYFRKIENAIHDVQKSIL